MPLIAVVTSIELDSELCAQFVGKHQRWLASVQEMAELSKRMRELSALAESLKDDAQSARSAMWEKFKETVGAMVEQPTDEQEDIAHQMSMMSR